MTIEELIEKLIEAAGDHGAACASEYSDEEDRCSAYGKLVEAKEDLLKACEKLVKK